MAKSKRIVSTNKTSPAIWRWFLTFLHTPGLTGLLAVLFLGLWLIRSALPGTSGALAAVGAGVLWLIAIMVQLPLQHYWARVRAWPQLSETMVVVGIVGLAAGLRFWGLGFGLPYREHPDEWAVADRAVRMLQTGDYNPGSFIYPTLFTYLQLLMATLHFLSGVGAGLYQTVDDLDLSRFYLWGRTLTALLGTAAVLLTYLIGRRCYSREVGVVAALFLAVFPAAVGDAHYITTDTPAMFFTLAAFLMISHVATTIYDYSNKRSLWLMTAAAGLLVGLAVSTKYNVAVLLLPLFVALWYTQAKPITGWVSLSAWFGLLPLALVGVALGFTLGTPLWLRELPQLLNDVASIIVHYRFEGHAGAESDTPVLFYAAGIFGQAWLLAGLCLLGLVVAFIRHQRSDLLILTFVVPTIVQMSSVQVVFFRNAMPLLPFLFLLAAVALVQLWGRWLVVIPGALFEGQRTFIARRWLAGVAVLIILQPFGLSMWDNWLRAQPTTRLLATAWLEQQATSGTRIWLEDQTVLLSDRFRIQGGRPVTTHVPQWYRENGFRYLVVNEETRRTDREALAAFGDPTIRFDNQQRHGPVLSIYDTGFGDVRAEPRTTINTSLGGGVILLEGYRHPVQSSAGSLLPVALYWEVRQPLGADYTVFVHLLDAQGNKVVQRDLPPLEGRRPTSQWQPGEFIRDDQDLQLPANLPPGTYHLVAGMYDARTMAAITEQGPIPLGEVKITK